MIPSTPKPFKKRIVYKQFDHGRLVSTPQTPSSQSQDLFQTNNNLNSPIESNNYVSPVIEEAPQENEEDEYTQAIQDLQLQYPDSQIQQGVLKVNLPLPSQHIKSTYNQQYSDYDTQDIKELNSVHINLNQLEKPQESSMEIQSTMKNDYRKPNMRYSFSVQKFDKKKQIQEEYYYPIKSIYQYEYINWGNQKQESYKASDLPSTLPGVKMKNESTYRNNYKEKPIQQKEEKVRINSNLSLGSLPFLGKQKLEYKVEFDKNKQKRFSESVQLNKSFAGQYVSESHKEYQKFPLIKHQKQLERTLIKISGK